MPIVAAVVAVAFAAPPGSDAEVFHADNGTVRVGIDRGKGASITWLSWKGHPKNAVNIHDPGRLIQQSYYAGRSLDRKADGQHKSWSPWPWNPIQGGGVGSWARVTRLEERDGPLLFAETVPKLWDMPDEEAEAAMSQWTGFEPDMPDVVVVRNRLSCKRGPDDRWGPAAARYQELPACYFTRNFDRFEVHLGGGQWREVTQKPGPPWGRAEVPRRAMACFNADGQGIAIFSPVSDGTWNFGPHGQGKSDQPGAGPCVHVAPIATVELGPRSVLEYRYWLVTGDRETIAARLDELWKRYSAERVSLE